ncbi:Growth differentiation factor 2 [Mactra antiquata]
MKKAHKLQTLAKCILLLCFVCDNLLDLTFSLPAHEDVFHASEIEEHIRTFKSDILNKLGYDRPPNISNITRNNAEEQRMIKKFEKFMMDREAENRKLLDDRDEEQEILTKTLYSLDYTGGRPDAISADDWFAKNSIRLYFKTPFSHLQNASTRELHVSSAKLRVTFANPRPENLKDKFSVDKLLRVNLHQILSINNSSDYKRNILDSILIDLLNPGMGTFEVGKAVQSWIDNNESNLGLELAAEIQDINEVIEVDSVFTSDSEDRVRNVGNVVKYLGDNSTDSMDRLNDEHSPSIDLYAQERQLLKRVKHSTRRRGDCRRGDGESRCCRYPIKISFKDIGWDDWVLAPHEYKGYYCAGKCPRNYKMTNTFAGIKAILHKQHPNKVPSPCCVATKLSPFTILHYDYDGKYNFSEYPDLVVEQCKCG